MLEEIRIMLFIFFFSILAVVMGYGLALAFCWANNIC